MDDRELIAAMHRLGEDLTKMAGELANRRGCVEYVAPLNEARSALGAAYGEVICSTTPESRES